MNIQKLILQRNRRRQRKADRRPRQLHPHRQRITADLLGREALRVGRRHGESDGDGSIAGIIRRGEGDARDLVVGDGVAQGVVAGVASVAGQEGGGHLFIVLVSSESWINLGNEEEDVQLHG